MINGEKKIYVLLFQPVQTKYIVNLYDSFREVISPLKESPLNHK